jgi:hypothetical protein
VFAVVSDRGQEIRYVFIEQSIPHVASIATCLHHPRQAQNAKLLRNRVGGEARDLRQFLHRTLHPGEREEHPQAGRCRERRHELGQMLRLVA